MNFKTLVTEDGGRSVKSDLVRSNPFTAEGACGRKECLMCSVEPSKGKCWKANVLYKITCNRSPCNSAGKVPTYVGETCRSTCTRGAQHFALYKGKKDNSFMWKHTLDKHQGKIGESDYKMEQVNQFQDPLTRILQEAVTIQRNETDEKTENLNSKMEYYGPEYVRPSFSKGPVDQW